MNWLQQLDTALFYLCNVTLANPQFDVIMPYLTEIDNWRIPIAIILIALCVFGGKTGRITTLLIVITITLTDQTSSSLIKPLVGRIRPCNALEGVRLLVKCTGSYSFPSSHATNMFGAAVIFSYSYKRLWPFFFMLAGLVAYSRVYVGVHYPFDIFTGAILGAFCAGLVLVLTSIITRLISSHRKKQRLDK